MFNVSRSRRQLHKTLIVSAVIFPVFVQAVPASAVTEPVLNVDYFRPTAECDTVSSGEPFTPPAGVASVIITTRQNRINPFGFEFLDSGTGFWNVFTGQWDYFRWDLTSDDFSQLLRPLAPDDIEIDKNFEPIHIFHVAGGHYRVATWYRWWVWTGQWSLYERAVWAGRYQRPGSPVFGGEPLLGGVCDTLGRLTFPLNGQLSSFAVSQAAEAVHLPQLVQSKRLMRVARPSARATQVISHQSPSCFGKNPTIVGTESADVLVGTTGPDVIDGRGGDDIIQGGPGADYICAGDGADLVSGDVGRDRIDGEGGGRRLRSRLPDPSDDVLLGGDGRDLVIGGEGFDIVDGGPGRDHLRGGGQALDILSYLFAPTGVTVDFGAGEARGEGRDDFSGFNAVIGSNSDDKLIGTSGQQWFVPLGGDDQVTGGTGSDVLVYLLSDQGVTVNLVDGDADGEGHDEPLREIEVVVGSPHDDGITGDVGYNLLVGLEGNDMLDGVAGDDTLEAGEGIDVCVHGLAYVECENVSDNLILPTPLSPEPAAGPSEPPPN